MGDVRSGLVIPETEEVALAICASEEDDGGDSVADDEKRGTDPDTEDRESVICEVPVVLSFSMSISIIISLLIIPPPPSSSLGALEALGRAATSGN